MVKKATTEKPKKEVPAEKVEKEEVIEVAKPETAKVEEVEAVKKEVVELSDEVVKPDIEQAPVVEEEKTQEAVESTPEAPLEKADEMPVQVADPLSGEMDEGSSKKQFIIKTLVIITALALVGIGLYLSYQFGYIQGKLSGEKVAALQKEEQVIPSPTEAPSVAKDAYTISILNGSGIAKEASKAKTLLEDAGYSVESVGNADSDTEDTIVASTADISESYLKEVKKILEKDYSSVKIKKLAKKGSTDILITVGSKKTEK